MSNSLEELATKLQKSPAFLLLGQNYLRLETGVDPFLTEVLRKYGDSVIGTEPQYADILRTSASESPEHALAWMDERCSRILAPKWLSTVAEFAWSGVYTSAIDDVWVNSFRSDWRELHPIFESKYRPIDPRNRSRLHATFLFGCVNKSEDTERPPLNRREWLTRKQEATLLAHRLPEIITPFGVFLIEGYGAHDWLSPDLLLPVLDTLTVGQAHLFSASDALERDGDLADAIAQGKLSPHRQSLAEYLARNAEAGFISLGKPSSGEGGARHLHVGDTVAEVPAEIWNQISGSATILDDTVIAPAAKLSKESRYRHFRNFLSDGSVRPVWSGYQRGFAFGRDFETTLVTRVRRRLDSKELQDKPIILHGQTGTGKTIALGALAYHVRNEKQYPVLFIERRTHRPSTSDINTFCKWAEDSGATATLVIWDGMLDIDPYNDLLQFLASRGRKIVVVGSCYRKSEAQLKGVSAIEAPALLNEGEMARFGDFLSDIDPSLEKLVEQHAKMNDNSFLVALYRLLPDSRSQIRTNVEAEVRTTEGAIRRHVEDQRPQVARSALAEQLFRAGFLEPEAMFSATPKSMGGEQVDDLQQLIGLVMVPARFGIKVPIELLLRALGKKGWDLVGVLSDFDIFRWSEDDVGNIHVGGRNALEARIIVQARLGSARTETAFAKQLLLELSPHDWYVYHPEVQFAFELVRSMGPNGQDQQYFAPFWQELSQVLTDLRTQRGVQNPRLMLQEAAFLREAVVDLSRKGTPAAQTSSLLDRAAEILRVALSMLEANRQNPHLQSQLLVDLAATLGSKATYLLDHSSKPEDSIRLLKPIRDHVFTSRTLDPENYHAIDALAWITKKYLENDILETQDRANAVADILHLFEQAELEDFGVYQEERFHSRQLEIGQLLGNSRMSDAAFSALLAQGSSAGFYLKASYIVGKLNAKELETRELRHYEREACRRAFEYLESHRTTFSGDGRCLYLLLRTWWMSRVGTRMFFGERQRVKLERSDWVYVERLIAQLMNAGEMYRAPSIKYLQALATFHLGAVPEAFALFRDLERESDRIYGRRRILRSYIATAEDGSAALYHGTVAWVNDLGTKGEVEVEELRRRVAFFPRDFNRPGISKHDSLPEFHIAFNYLGPLADPKGYLSSGQSRRHAR